MNHVFQSFLFILFFSAFIDCSSNKKIQKEQKSQLKKTCKQKYINTHELTKNKLNSNLEVTNSPEEDFIQFNRAAFFMDFKLLFFT